VNDGSSATLMSDLYRGIANGGAPSAALREAKLDMIHSGRVWRKPWYWAPFQLYTVGASVD
jgi:CHAT domain-containing protein